GPGDPGGALRGALRDHVAGGGDDSGDPGDAAVRRLLAEPAAGGDEPRGGEEADRLASALLRLTATRPVLLVADDAEEVDAQSAAAVRAVLRSPARAPLLVLAAAEQQRLGAEHLRGLQDLDERGLLTRLDLGPLDLLEAHDLVHAVVDGDDLVPHLGALHRGSGGNPYLLTRLAQQPVRRRHDEHDEHDEHDGGGPPPVHRPDEGVRAYARIRCADLGADALTLLRTAAVAGSGEGAGEEVPVGTPVLAVASGLGERRTAAALSELCAHGLLVEAPPARPGSPPRPPRFVHGVLRDVLYAQLSTSEQRVLHAVLADALGAAAARGGPREPGPHHHRALAEHVWRSRPDHGGREVLDVCERAAQEAADAGEPHEAARWWRHLLSAVPEDDLASRALASVRLGRLELATGTEGHERHLFGGLFDALRSDRVDLAVSAAAALLDSVARRPGLLADVLAVDDLVAEQLPGAGPAAGELDRWLPDYAARRLRVSGRALPRPLLQRALEPLACRLEHRTGPLLVHQRCAEAEDLWLLAGAVGDDPARLHAAAHGAAAAAVLGRPRGPHEARLRAVAGCSAGPAGGPLAGQVRDALRQGAFARATADGTLDARGWSEALGVTGAPGGAGAAAGADPARRQALVASWAGLGVGAAPRGPAGPVDHCLEQLLAAGEAAARSRARWLVPTVLADAPGDAWWHSVGVLAVVVADTGDEHAAVPLLEALRPLAGLTCGHGDRSDVGPADLHRGRLAFRAGAWDEAEESLTAAIAQAARRGATTWLVRAQTELATVLEGRGRVADRVLAAALRAEAGRVRCGNERRPAPGPR
ncbi:hypothetical protein MN205_02360, partial [Kineococcus sp. TRM81007]|uniref:hypothetical protein n=1 Tax=Kineococcus sp. TRM81007 TaxID=2925831 RepID=UPI001F56E49E